MWALKDTELTEVRMRGVLAPENSTAATADGIVKGSSNLWEVASKADIITTSSYCSSGIDILHAHVPGVFKYNDRTQHTRTSEDQICSRDSFLGKLQMQIVE